jgi:ribosome-associated heat shock protein Hsp15
MGDLPLNGVLRLDKWLWYARFMKSRSKATKFCQSSRFCVNSSIVIKAHFLVKQNDVLTFSIDNNIKIIRILNLGVRRGSASEAQALYQDISPSISLNKEDHEFQVVIGKREIGSGRPTKDQRRATDKLIAKDEQWQ